MSAEGDALLQHVQAFVHGRVPPEHEEIVTELVARSVVLVMTTPAFVNSLTVVQQLQRENWNLRQVLIQYQQAEMARRQRSVRAAATRARKASPKKAPAKKAPAKRAPVRAKKMSPNAAFKRGAAGR